MANEKKTFEIELPDYFVHNGKTFDPGTHTIEDEAVFNDLTAAKERLLESRRKEAEREEQRIASLNVHAATIPVGASEGVYMDQIQALIDQAVDAKTAELSAKIEEQKTCIEELETALEEEPDPDESAPAQPE